jgi:hypothetical protein
MAGTTIPWLAFRSQLHEELKRLLQCHLKRQKANTQRLFGFFGSSDLKP